MRHPRAPSARATQPGAPSLVRLSSEGSPFGLRHGQRLGGPGHDDHPGPHRRGSGRRRSHHGHAAVPEYRRGPQSGHDHQVAAPDARHHLPVAAAQAAVGGSLRRHLPGEPAAESGRGARTRGVRAERRRRHPHRPGDAAGDPGDARLRRRRAAGALSDAVHAAGLRRRRGHRRGRAPGGRGVHPGARPGGAHHHRRLRGADAAGCAHRRRAHRRRGAAAGGSAVGRHGEGLHRRHAFGDAGGGFRPGLRGQPAPGRAHRRVRGADQPAGELQGRGRRGGHGRPRGRGRARRHIRGLRALPAGVPALAHADDPAGPLPRRRPLQRPDGPGQRAAAADHRGDPGAAGVGAAEQPGVRAAAQHRLRPADQHLVRTADAGRHGRPAGDAPQHPHVPGAPQGDRGVRPRVHQAGACIRTRC